jgi:hypothetical protein
MLDTNIKRVYKYQYGRLTQLVECLFYMQNVIGSIPVAATIAYVVQRKGHP